MTLTNRNKTLGYTLAACLLSSSCHQARSQPVLEQPATPVETQVVQTTTQEEQRRYSGYTHPWQAHGIGFMVAGRVTSIKVDQGDRVKKGQLLAKISPGDYALVKKLTEIQTNSMKPNLERLDRLVQKRVVPQSQLDEVQGRYDAALTQHRQAKRQLRYTRLRSPISGVVHEINSAPGQVVGVGAPVVVVFDLSKIKIKFGVSQRDLEHFQLGKSYPVEFPGIDTTRQGTVQHIGYVADPQTRTFDVVLKVDNRDQLLRPSMLAHLHVVTELREGIFVPLHAVKRSPGAQPMVLLADTSAGLAKQQLVTLGPIGGETIQILQGLNGGEHLITRGQEFITHDDKVIVR